MTSYSKIFQKIFSVRNADERHKVIYITGIKIKIKRKKKYNNDRFLDFAKVKTIENNYFCTGCGACKNICPHNAITMQENSEGFFHPVIDESKCTKCNLCNKICPIINYEAPQANVPPKTFAAQTSDVQRVKSSSGGLFGVIAEYILKSGGYVCGAKYSDDFYSVEHTIISDISDLPKLLVSKYVQSDLSDVFTKIKDLLDNEKTVLFVGTPCQVAGIKSYLRKDYKNLFLIDLVCCGIPSRKAYRKYLDEIKYNKDEKITNVIFRLKDKGWYSQAIKIVTNEREYRIPNGKCTYEQAHFKGLSTNKICQVCPYDITNREGDLTLGDFWGIADFDKKLDDNKGTSVVMLNTKKGEFILNKISKDLKLFRKTPFEWVIPYNENIIKPIKHKNRKQFFHNLDRMSISDNYSQCIRDVADCIVFNNVLTDINYGSMLTAYALQEVLAELGYYSKNINHARVPLRSPENSFARKFINEYINLTEEVNTENDFIKLNNKTNIFMVGSDQMWRPKYWKNKLDKILLNFVEPSKKKYAIAMSFGLDFFEGTDDEKALFNSSIKNYNAISVREKNGINICKNDFDYNAEWILDPVFILNKSKWYELSERSSIDCSDQIVYYGWNTSEIFQNNIEDLAKKLNCEYRNITFENLNVEDWLRAIRTAKYVISDSYHGICFAIIFNKPFLCINDLGQDRFASIFELFNITNNIIDKEEELTTVDTIQDINYEFVNSQLEKEKEKAFKFLQQIGG